MKTVRKFEDARDRVRKVVEQTSRSEPRTITPSSATKEGDLVDFFRRSPLRRANLDLERKQDSGRVVDL